MKKTISFLLVLLLAASPTLAQSETPTPSPTAAPPPITLRLLVEPDWLVINVASDEPVWLRGLQLRTQARTATIESDFDVLTLANSFVPPGTCLVYRLAGSTLPLPSVCALPNRIFQREVPRADVFWYDFVAFRPRAIAIIGDGVPSITGELCPASLPDCPVSWLIPATSTPMPTDIGTSVPTQAPTAIVMTISAAPAYPCDGNIMSRSDTSLMLNIVREYASRQSPFRTALQQGTGIRILKKWSNPTQSDESWYQIASPDNTVLGWVLAEHIVPSEDCPR